MTEKNNKCHDCKDMGLCCHFSVLESGTLYILPDHHCKYLGPDKKCMIYPVRHEVNPECATMEEFAKYGGPPKHCNYKDDYDFKYRKIKVASKKEGKRLYKKIKKAGKFRHSRMD